MERHEFDAAYARICEVCGMKTQTELSAYLGIRQSSISDAKRRVAWQSPQSAHLTAGY